jgi:hypothetical protein
MLDLSLPAWQDDDFVLCVCERNRVAFVDVIAARMSSSADSISRSSNRQLVGLSSLLGKWEQKIVREFGVGRLVLWRLRQIGIVCLLIGEELEQADRSSVLAAGAGRVLGYFASALGRGTQALVRPFFDRMYV